jgi:phosphoglycolate phosphatase-like HAD superfamily hydrolase
MKTYLLFDIDGTLINTGGVGLRALKQVATECLGDPDLLDGCSFAGKTDRWIIHDLVRRSGTQDDPGRKVPELYTRYIELLGKNLKKAEKFFVYPQAADILQRLSLDSGLELALLTGNLEQGARLKLEYAGLWHYFQWGVFGEVSEERNDLSRKALKIITEKDGQLDPRRMVIIGDTVGDIRCGQAVGATTIAYSAGFQPPEKLLPANPDYITDDLSTVPAIIKQLQKNL